MNISPFLTIHHSCDETLQWTKKQLSQAGLRSMQTFDLYTARARFGLHDCPCPNHGTDECDCQMVVLLVYGESTEPATLILHGNDGQTWVSISENSNQKTSAKTASAIKNVLDVKLHPQISNQL